MWSQSFRNWVDSNSGASRCCNDREMLAAESDDPDKDDAVALSVSGVSITRAIERTNARVTYRYTRGYAHVPHTRTRCSGFFHFGRRKSEKGNRAVPAQMDFHDRRGVSQSIMGTLLF